MTLQACADLVRRGDPDRFLATMAAPPPARRILFPLYAFNLEVARAPWMVSEPMIAEMRLQFWRDVVEEMGQGAAPRAHEVAAPLSEALPASAAPQLDALITARRWDIYKDAFEDQAHFDAYLDATSGNLAWVAAQALGADAAAEGPIRAMAFAAGIAALLRAVPELEARNRIPLLDGTPDGVRALTRRGLEKWREGRAAQSRIARPARAALLALWRTGPILLAAQSDPARVAGGRLEDSEFVRRARLLKAQLTGRV